jgi:hypothetical protein
MLNCNILIFNLEILIKFVRFIAGSLRFYLIYLKFRAFIVNDKLIYLAIKINVR